MNRKDYILTDPQVTTKPHVFNTNSKLTAKCHRCHKYIQITLGRYWSSLKKNGKPWICYPCRKPELIEKSKNNPKYKDPKYRDKFRKLHKDPNYHKKVHNNQVYQKISQSSKEAWKDDQKRKNHLKHRDTQEFKQKISKWSKNQWQNESYVQSLKKTRDTKEFRDKLSNNAKKLWENKEYRDKITKALQKARLKSHPKRISSLQTILYSILDDLNIKYYKEGPETTLGPINTTNSKFEGYCFDCLVIHNGTKLLIECHGEYWHSNREPRDMAKATFLRNYYQDYDLLVIWEHEFRSPNLVANILKTKLNIDPIKIIDFNFNQVIISQSEPTQELKSLLAKYHYLANIGRIGSIRYIATIKDKIIAAAIFSSPTRKESAKRLELKSRQLLELTRFCIHPQFQKKNFASWFLSKTIKSVWNDKPLIQTIITFADTTYGHEGTIYKACNFTYDGDIKPDYWYRKGGAWFHKKTIWDHATKIGVKESKYANDRGLIKVIGKPKRRYIMNRH